MAAAVTRRRTGELDWARHESKIRHLYLEQDETLQAVMSRMVHDHGFHASKSQYETRFKKWGINKNRKRGEWKSILRHIKHREDMGKMSIVFLEGSRLPDVKLQREASRLGPQPLQGYSLEEIDLPLPVGFRIQTPSPQRDELIRISELPTIQFYRGLCSSLSTIATSSIYPQPAFLGPQALTLRGILSSEVKRDTSHTDSYHSAISHVPYRPKFPTIVASQDDRLMALLPPALTSLRAAGNSSENDSWAVAASNYLDSPFVRMTIFEAINGFIGMDGVAPARIWSLLKEDAGTQLYYFLRRFPSYEAKVVSKQLFQCAIEAGDADAVKFFLDTPGINVDPNELCRRPEGYAYSPIALACLFQHVSVVKVILLHGGRPNRDEGSPESLYTSALQLACTAESASRDYTRSLLERQELVNLLLHHGAVITFTILDNLLRNEEEMFEFLFRAAPPSDQVAWSEKLVLNTYHGLVDKEVVWRLFEEILQYPAITAILPGSLLLESAVAAGKVGIVRRLLSEHGLEVDDRILYFAIRNGHLDVLRILEEARGITDYHMSFNAFPASVESRNQDMLKHIEDHGGLCQVNDPKMSHAAFKAAFETGDFGLARRLLDLEAPYTLEILGTGLLKAIQAGEEGFAARLLEAGANPNRDFLQHDETEGHLTPLSLALRAGNQKLVKMLLSSPEISLTTPPFTHMIDAVKFGDQSIIEDLIFAGSPLNVTAQSTTPLITAVMKGDKALVDMLLRLGASMNLNVLINTADPYKPRLKVNEDQRHQLHVRKRMTPMGAAVLNSDIEMMAFLFSRGADPADSYALAEAFYSENEKAADLILTNFRQKYPYGLAGFGYLVMRCAVRMGDVSMVKKLLSYNISFPTLASLRATQDPEKFYIDKTPLAEAIERSDDLGFALLRMLLEADQNSATKGNLNVIVSQTGVWHDKDFRTRSETALLVAIRVKQLDKVKFLIEKGAAVNASPSRGVSLTPLQMAVEVGDFKITEYLINCGADVNAPATQYGGATALQFASGYGYAGIMDLLLRHGADVDAPAARWDGRTALEAAAENGRLDNVMMLLNVNVRIDGVFGPQFTRAIQLARERGNFVVAELLESRDPLRRIEASEVNSADIDLVTEAHEVFEIDDFVDWGEDLGRYPA